MQSIYDFLSLPATNDVTIAGLAQPAFALLASSLFYKNNRSILLVTSSLYEANQMVDAISSFSDDVLLFPMDEFLTSEAIAISPDLLMTRLETLRELRNGPKIVVTDLMGYLRFLPTKKEYESHFINLEVGQKLDRDDLVQKLFQMGYKREVVVTRTGEIGVRGFVVDVFPLGEMNPVRIVFFDDEIEEIKYFDSDNQKSLTSIKKIIINPCTDFLITSQVEEEQMKQKYLPDYLDEVGSIVSYLDRPITVFKDYKDLKESYNHLMEEVYEYQLNDSFKGKYMHGLEEIPVEDVIYYDSLATTFSKDKNVVSFPMGGVPIFMENVDLLKKYFKDNLELEKTIILYLKDYQLHALQKELPYDFKLTDVNNIYLKKINVILGSLSEGFSIENTIFMGQKELFKEKASNKKYKTNFQYASKILDINKLSIGDYVVHQINGIGVYNGIKTISSHGIVKDYIEVLYASNDKLYIPVEKIDLISKYSSKEGVTPKINKLGSQDWQKTTARVRKKVQDIAKELIALYAKREHTKGYAFSMDTPLQKEFESQFPYNPTKDQLVATEQIKKDMESPRPMDRLLCGDVGFGKTEVAFRAIFKAIMDHKQVLYLCPTTILSSQQFQNAMERFKEYPVNIYLLNRFTTPKEERAILQALELGTADLVIGTHRLLSSDIQPKDLGLLIIDEEQRFGVTHKEKIKKYKSNVDVLTLTATPIPRTLQMSLTGIRSLSLITTPPVNRYPIQTYVIEEGDALIKNAIYKELSRDGQVFLLYNRVEKIEEYANYIRKLVPDATVIVAHGQMNKETIEDHMLHFINHDADVMICTTIIETGIDIPNVNTLIIKDAENFGLSQLYQIRGRVGRSNKIAYAYLMYQKNKVLTEQAVKRLNVIKEFTELGSGFSIATRDLSIRGAGDILGSEQAGFIDTVGMDLYLKILNEEILRNQDVEPEKEEETPPLISVTTHISDEYVMDDDLKIEIHKRINEIDSFEKLEEVKQELIDRFGKIDDDILLYMHEEWFEKLAKKVHVKKIENTRNSIALYFDIEESKKIDTEQLFMDAFKITTMFRFANKRDQLVIILDTIKLDKHPLYYLIPILSSITYKLD